MTSIFRIQQASQLTNWDQFVASNPNGHIFHTTGMQRAFGRTPRHQVHAHAAVDPMGEILAMLVSVRINTLKYFDTSLSARAILYAEPISDGTAAGRQAISELLASHDRWMRRRTLFAELRPIHSCQDLDDSLQAGGYQRLGYLNYELDLNHSTDFLFKGLEAKCRNGIRSSERRGLIVREVQPLDQLEQSYQLFQSSYAHAKVPLVTIDLFRAAIETLPAEQIRMFIAEYQGNLVASRLFLYFGQQVTYWYAGALRISGIAAMSSILWEVIRDASEGGFQVFDFGGAGWEGESYGPGRFKSQFGARMTNYGRYRKIYAPRKMRYAESAYARLRGMLSPRMVESASTAKRP